MEELNNPFTPNTDSHADLSLEERENLGLLELIGDADTKDMDSDEAYFDLLTDK